MVTGEQQAAEQERLASALEQATQQLLAGDFWLKKTPESKRAEQAEAFLNDQGDPAALEALVKKGRASEFDEALRTVKEFREQMEAAKAAPTESLEERAARTAAEWQTAMDTAKGSDLFDAGSKGKDRAAALMDGLGGKVVSDAKLNKHLLARGKTRADFDAAVESLREPQKARDEAAGALKAEQETQKKSAAELAKRKADEEAARSVAEETARKEAEAAAAAAFATSPEGQRKAVEARAEQTVKALREVDKATSGVQLDAMHDAAMELERMGHIDKTQRYDIFEGIEKKWFQLKQAASREIRTRLSGATTEAEAQAVEPLIAQHESDLTFSQDDARALRRDVEARVNELQRQTEQEREQEKLFGELGQADEALSQKWESALLNDANWSMDLPWESRMQVLGEMISADKALAERMAQAAEESGLVPAGGAERLIAVAEELRGAFQQNEQLRRGLEPTIEQRLFDAAHGRSETAMVDFERQFQENLRLAKMGLPEDHPRRKALSPGIAKAYKLMGEGVGRQLEDRQLKEAELAEQEHVQAGASREQLTKELGALGTRREGLEKNKEREALERRLLAGEYTDQKVWDAHGAHRGALDKLVNDERFWGHRDKS